MPLHEDSLILKTAIPRQLGSRLVKTIIELTKEIIKPLAIGAVIWSIILELVASKLLKRVWPMLFTLQCIILLILYHTYLPNQVKELITYLHQTIEMQNVKEVASQWGEKYYTKNYSEKGKSIFESPVVLIFVILVPLILALIAILSICICCLDKCK
jgi:hypothetical protein